MNELYEFEKSLKREIFEDNKTFILLHPERNFSLRNFSKSLSEDKNYMDVYYTDAINNYSLKPYYPFLYSAEEIYRKEKGFKDLNKLNIYPLHKDIFNNYFLRGSASREEELLFFDYKYEKYKIFESLFEILNNINNSLKYIFIDNINFLPYSSIEWITWILKKNKELNFKIIATSYTDKYFDSIHQSSFDKLVDVIDYNQIILQQSSFINNSNENLNFNSELNMSLEDCKNCYYFLDFNSALKGYLLFYNDIIKFDLLNNDEELPEDTIDIIFKIGDIYTFYERYDEALSFYNIIINKSISNNNTLLKIKAMQKISLLNIACYNFQEAEIYAKKSYKLLLETNDSYLRLKTLELFFWINEKGKYRSTIEDFGFDEEFIALCKELNQKNLLAYFLTHNFNAISYYNPKDMREDYYKEGHILAQELQNENCIQSAHLKTALVYALNGDHCISMDYYAKVERTLETMGDYLKLAQTYNGMGYYSSSKENYIEANNLYKKALSNLKVDWNFDEICMTLINIGLNCILACDYNFADKSFNIFLSIANILQLKRLRITTISRIYGLIGLNNYYLKNYHKSKYYLNKMTINNFDKNNCTHDEIDEIFLYYFLKALLCKNSKENIDSIEYFKKAFNSFSNLKGSLQCLFPKLMIEYCSTLKALNLNKEYLYYRQIIEDYCIKTKSSFYLNILRDNNISNFNLGKNMDLIWVIEAAKQTSTISKLNHKIDEINFINILQETLSFYDNNRPLVDNYLKLLDNRFSLDCSLFIESKDNKIKNIFYSNLNNIKRLNNFSDLSKVLISYNYSFSTNSPKDYLPLFNELEKFILFNIDSFTFVPIINSTNNNFYFLAIKKTDISIFYNEIDLDKDNLNLMNISIRQLSETIEKNNTKEDLIKLASTDMLTSLYNRQAFYKEIDNFEVDIKKNSTYNKRLCYLIYIDLDNFKYYNDTFGHYIGDKVLIWFANILNNVFTNEDLIIRYGGDEFIVFIKDSNEATVLQLISKLYFILNNCEGFKLEIEDLLKKNIKLDSKKSLSCSIGISYESIEDNIDITKLINLADDALYKAKKNGKHGYVLV